MSRLCRKVETEMETAGFRAYELKPGIEALKDIWGERLGFKDKGFIVERVWGFRV